MIIKWHRVPYHGRIGGGIWYYIKAVIAATNGGIRGGIWCYIKAVIAATNYSEFRESLVGEEEEEMPHRHRSYFVVKL